MTNDDIIRMAREALKEDDGEDYYAYTHQIPHWWGKEDEILKFANLVAAAEREACASLEIEVVVPTKDYSSMTPLDCYEAALMDQAIAFRKAIRARGQQ